MHLTYVYPDGTEALRDVSLAVPRGRRVAVLGANGCGKSTLFLHLNGILRPASGELRLAGERVRYDRALRRRVGLVFQDPDSQLFTANVHEDISFGPLNLGWGAPEVRQRVEQAIRDTQIEDLVDRPTHLLSYGQKKRVAIAGVLAMEPEVIVADEPTAGLDPEMSARLMELLDRLRDLGRTVLISTHDVELALAWADHVIVLREGRVVGTGEPGEVFRNADLLRQARLLPPSCSRSTRSSRSAGYCRRFRTTARRGRRRSSWTPSRSTSAATTATRPSWRPQPRRWPRAANRRLQTAASGQPRYAHGSALRNTRSPQPRPRTGGR